MIVTYLLRDYKQNDLPLRCKCKYELRNLTVMKVVVILVIWVIGLLVIYMAFLACLEPVLNREVQCPYGAPM